MPGAHATTPPPEPASGGASSPPARLRARDAAAIAAMPDLLRLHTNVAGWYNNATFALPALAAFVLYVAWAIVGNLELLGFAIFLTVVTGVMLPLVWLTWQRTPTAVVLRSDGIEALHQGRSLRRLAWADVTAVRRAETMGNVRWYIVARSGDHLTIEGEIEDVPGLLAAARSLAGLPPDVSPPAPR